MVTEAIKAVDLLEKDGLDVGVLNVCTWKPIDEEAIVAAAARTGAIVTAENCSDINGLGDAVACVLSENLPDPADQGRHRGRVRAVGLITPEKDELMEHFALSAADLAVSVKECIKKKERLRRPSEGMPGRRSERAAGARSGKKCWAAGRCLADSPRWHESLVIGGSGSSARSVPACCGPASSCGHFDVPPRPAQAIEYAGQVQVRARRHLRPAAGAGGRQ